MFPGYWTVYIIECNDKTLYTGITKDLARRLQEHGTSKGAKYTRGKGPFTIVYTESFITKNEALRREVIIKALDRTSKRMLLSNDYIPPVLTYDLNTSYTSDL